MASIAAPVDPNVAELKKRLYSQQAGGDPPVPYVNGPEPSANMPSVSPDFKTGTNQLPTPSKTLMGDDVPTMPSGPAPAVPIGEPVRPFRPPLSVYNTGTPGTYNTGTEPTKAIQPEVATQAPTAVDTTAPAAAAPPANAGSVEDAVLANYKTLGATPTGPGTGPTDSAYFIRRINETGGATPENLAYWMGPNGRIAKELRHEVSPEQAVANTPPNRAAAPQLAAPTSTPTAAITGSGSAHRPGQGVPGVYDFDNAGNPVTAMGAPYYGPMADGSPNPNTAGPAAGGGGNDFQKQVRDALMARLKELGQPVDEQSSGISSAVSGARDEASRASDQERTALAERLYAQGGGGLQSGALTQQIQQSGEKNAANLSGLRATLIMQQYSQRQQELQQTLNTAVASGDAEAARQAQAAIAALQAQIAREGLGLDAAKYQAYLNQQAALAGLNG